LKCRICGSWSSSQFAAEELTQFRGDDKKNSFHYQMLQAGAWPRENEKFWTEIDSILADIRYIEFTGGEPFMIEEHFEMLQGIVDRGIAHQVEIHYNTNGTHYPEQAPEIWRHFKTVEIAFSIDDLGLRFEYQRTNAVWDKVEENITKFNQLKAQHTNIQLQCCSTVNVFNVRYIDELAQWIVQQQFDFVYWNMMHDAWYFSISTLPDDAKSAIADHLNSADVPKRFREEFDRIVEFMTKGASTDGNIMRMRIRDLDRKREQNLATVEPEFAAAINYDYATN
jgi:MoaA/NifB/PqqE/SkfB family radical SAM enzyme